MIHYYNVREMCSRQINTPTTGQNGSILIFIYFLIVRIDTTQCVQSYYKSIFIADSGLGGKIYATDKNIMRMYVCRIQIVTIILK